jgi:tRNA-dihydrouridine synthase 3
MTARGALIKPWLFREVADGYRDLTAEERLAIYRRYVALALEHWRDDERGRKTVRAFTVWHLNFWHRYTPRRADGSWPTMQTRESDAWATAPLERLLARADVTAHAWIADRLIAGEEIDPHDAPAPTPEPPDDRDRAMAGDFAQSQG